MCLLSFLLYLYFLVTGLYPSRISFSRKRQNVYFIYVFVFVFHLCLCVCICICWRRVSALPRSASPARGKKAQKSFEQIHSLEKTSTTGSIHSPDRSMATVLAQLARSINLIRGSTSTIFICILLIFIFILVFLDLLSRNANRLGWE